jgi:hypothetical protein
MGKLLLKCDGILVERWNPIEDSLPAEVIPPRWDAVHVGKRFSDALQVLFKMPLSRTFPRGFACCWPAYRKEFDDLISMLADSAGEAIRLFAEERNYVKIPPSSLEISNMEAAIGWQSDYPAARGCSIEDVTRRGRHAGTLSPTIWREMGLAAAVRIAAGLIADRVGVF